MCITAIIVTHNNAATIALSLQSSYSAPQIAQCIVIDNASTDHTTEIVRSQFPNVRLICNALDMGYGAAYDQALILVRTEFALLLSADAIIDSEDIQTLLEYFSDIPKLAMVGSAIDGYSNDIRPPAIRVGHLRAARHQKHLSFSGAAALWHMARMKRSGFFDPAFFLDYGDDNITARVEQAGYKALLIDGHHAIHQPPRSNSRKHTAAQRPIPLVNYWKSLFTQLETHYTGKLTKVGEELDADMQQFAEQERASFAAHQAREAAMLAEFRKIPETNPAEQARIESILKNYRDAWQATITQHQKNMAEALKEHDKKCARITTYHEAAWAALGARQDAYLRAFAHADRSLTHAGHYVVFSCNQDMSRDRVDTITIAIITYKRPDHLSRALRALKDITLPPSSTVKLLVVDNDLARSARPAVQDAIDTMPFPIDYAIEETRGIPYARNKALELAADSDYIAFIDDDDTADPQWLCALVDTARRFHADTVKGQVVYTLSEKHRHLANLIIFSSSNAPTGYALPSASTDNVLFSTAIYKNTGLHFDPAFTRTGGSDYHFFRTAKSNDAKIVFASEGIVYSDVSSERTTWRWIIRRYTRYGAVGTISDIKHRGYPYAVGQVMLALGTSGWNAITVTIRTLAGTPPAIHPLLVLCFMAGRVMGLLRLSPREYK